MQRLLDFSVIDEDRIQEMVRCIERRDYTPIKQYVMLVKEYWNNTVKYFKNFKALYEETITISSNTESSMDKQEDNTNNTKTKYEVVSQTATGVALGTGVVATGIVASTIAGFFTFGLGTIAGLALTAGAGMAAGATASVMTEKVDELARKIRRLQAVMKIIQRDITQLGDIVNSIETSLQQIEENRGMLERVVEMEVSTANVTRVLYNTNKGITEVSTGTGYHVEADHRTRTGASYHSEADYYGTSSVGHHSGAGRYRGGGAGYHDRYKTSGTGYRSEADHRDHRRRSGLRKLFCSCTLNDED